MKRVLLYVRYASRGPAVGVPSSGLVVDVCNLERKSRQQTVMSIDGPRLENRASMRNHRRA
jgi:hypothetical protein